VGVERRLFPRLLSLDGTYFRTRYYDKIVILGGVAGKLEPFPIGQFGELAGAGRGIFGDAAAGRAGSS